MPCLSRDLVELKLPIKPRFRPFKQAPRSFNPLLHSRIKEEIDRLLKAKCIQPCRYAKWVSNIVPIEKKNTDKIRVCVDFRNLNRATPKDEYPMPLAESLINRASGNRIISFLDGNAGCNQIFMAKEDVAKTAFRCPGFAGLFQWVVMTFVLKNVGATYQRAMNLIFHDLHGMILEIYIDDLVVKSAEFVEHLADLRLVFKRMRKYKLEMNPLKCAFGVSAGRFLGFVVHENGIEVDPKKIEAINKIKEPTCKKDVQSLLGKINYLRRFISNMAGKVENLLPVVRLKHEKDFVWGAAQQEAFERIKEYLTRLPVLQAPRVGKAFRLYVAAGKKVLGAVLMQDVAGKEGVIAYLSRRVVEMEARYTHVERLCLALFYACSKLWQYLLSSSCTVVSQYDVMRHMMHKPILSGCLGKWAYSLVECELSYEPLRAMKGQVVAEFIVDYEIRDDDICMVTVTPWKLFFNGSIYVRGNRVGCVLVAPGGEIREMAIRLEFKCTNNQAEYEALVVGLEILMAMKVRDVEAFGDSNLVVQQLRGESQCLDGKLNEYREKCVDMIRKFDTFCIEHIHREQNKMANGLAQQASGYEITRGDFLVKDGPKVCCAEDDHTEGARFGRRDKQG
jgi:ribonuclease HI